MRGRFSSTLLALSIGVACAGPSRGEAGDSELRVALLTPGPISDQPWNGEAELPPVREGFDAYAAGARCVNPDIRVLVSYVGNWEDVSAGREQALAQMSRGADVIFQNADAVGLGVFQAARESGKALVVDANADQNGVAPGVVLGSAVIDLPSAFLTVARTVRDTLPLPGVFALGAETGVVRFVLNPPLADRISTHVRQRLDSVWSIMVAGGWQSPVSRHPYRRL